RCALRRLQRLLGQVSSRRACGRSSIARPGVIRLNFASVAVAVVCTATALGAATASLPNCDVASGWSQSGAARTYTADNLYDYMDGNSEGYLIYGFKQMRGITCKSGEVSFVVDISEMNDSE